MQLRPVSATDSPSYPSRNRNARGSGGWVRRVSLTMAAAAGLWVVGCLPFGVSGAMIEPAFFACSESLPDAPPALHGPGTVDGELCGEDKAWATIEVVEPYRARLEISGNDAAVVHIIDPAGYEVERLSAESPSVELDLSAGTWTLAVDSEDDEWGWFDLTLSEI